MKPFRNLSIPFFGIESEMVIKKGLLEGSEWIHCLRQLGKRVAIITDHQVRDFFGYAIKNKLADAGCEAHLFSVPPGEQSKTRHFKEMLEDQMLTAKLGRDTVIIALGGGVITDLAGFVAATYCRGIPFISIPTTLLAQVDASLGGKVGINTSHGKNLIGTYHHPRSILIDTHTLSTLSAEEMQNGMAEVIKYALIASKSLFHQLQGKLSLEDVIRECCLIKKQIVEKDPQEQGLRRILNFGHTIGHAIETILSYNISHGKAVAIGLWVESFLSYRLGYLKEEELHQIRNLLEQYKFSLDIPISEAELLEAIKIDKKAQAGEARFVLLQEIGRPLSFNGVYCQFLEPQLLVEVLHCLR